MKRHWIYIIILITCVSIIFIHNRHSIREAGRLKIKSLATKRFDNYNPILKMRDLVDYIYLISIPKRRKYALDALKSFDIQPELIKPILKENLIHYELLQNDIIIPDLKYRNMGRIACHLSHMRSLRTFLDNTDAQTALIFEDDVKKCQDIYLYQRS